MLAHTASLVHMLCYFPLSLAGLVYLDYGHFEEGTLLLPIFGCQLPNLHQIFGHITLPKQDRPCCQTGSEVRQQISW